MKIPVPLKKESLLAFKKKNYFNWNLVHMFISVDNIATQANPQ